MYFPLKIADFTHMPVFPLGMIAKATYGTTVPHNNWITGNSNETVKK